MCRRPRFPDPRHLPDLDRCLGTSSTGPWWWSMRSAWSVSFGLAARRRRTRRRLPRPGLLYLLAIMGMPVPSSREFAVYDAVARTMRRRRWLKSQSVPFGNLASNTAEQSPSSGPWCVHLLTSSSDPGSGVRGRSPLGRRRSLAASILGMICCQARWQVRLELTH
jgi:hypothetical protein